MASAWMTHKKCSQINTVGLFLIAMPLFLYKESKSRDFKDYMLTDENVRKMQGKPPRKSKDS